MAAPKYTHHPLWVSLTTLARTLQVSLAPSPINPQRAIDEAGRIASQAITAYAPKTIDTLLSRAFKRPVSTFINPPDLFEFTLQRDAAAYVARALLDAGCDIPKTHHSLIQALLHPTRYISSDTGLFYAISHPSIRNDPSVQALYHRVLAQRGDWLEEIYALLIFINLYPDDLGTILRALVAIRANANLYLHLLPTTSNITKEDWLHLINTSALRPWLLTAPPQLSRAEYASLAQDPTLAVQLFPYLSRVSPTIIGGL